MAINALVVAIILLACVSVFEVQGSDSKRTHRSWLHHSNAKPADEPQISNVRKWIDYKSDDIITASTADVYRNNACTRFVKFSARGTLLEYVKTYCDIVNPLFGLIKVNHDLFYFKNALVREGPNGDTVTVIVPHYVHSDDGTYKTQCMKRTYTVYAGSSSQANSETTVDRQNDAECDLLFTGPRMTLLRAHQRAVLEKEPPTYIEDKSIYFYNRYDPVGVALKDYNKNIGCYRLVTITTFGTLFDSFKTDCGAVTGLFISDREIVYGTVAHVKSDQRYKTFTVLLNPRTGSCIKRTIDIEPDINGDPARKFRSSVVVPGTDQECQTLIQGKASKKFDAAKLAETQKGVLEHSLDLAPQRIDLFLGGILLLSQMELKPWWTDFNIGSDLAVITRYYVWDGAHFLVNLLVAKGVIVDAVKSKSMHAPDIVIRENVFYLTGDFMFKKEDDQKTFSVLVNREEVTCSRSKYVVTTEEGKPPHVKKLPTTLLVYNQECRTLIKGTIQFHPKAMDHGALKDGYKYKINTMDYDPQNRDVEALNF